MECKFSSDSILFIRYCIRSLALCMFLYILSLFARSFFVYLHTETDPQLYIERILPNPHRSFYISEPFYILLFMRV